MNASSLPDLLHARRGIICLVGAGGKKTTLYRLAESLYGRVAITTTTQIEEFRQHLAPIVVIGSETEIPERIVASGESSIVAYAQPSTKPGRYAGLSPSSIAQIHTLGQFDVTLVKADGARGRLAKAPNATEPPLPPGTTTVIPLVSIQAVGKALDDKAVHRVEQFAAVTGACPDHPIEGKHIVRLLTSPEGALHHCGDALVVPIINMVETVEELSVATAIARAALANTDRFDRIALMAMNRPDPIVRVIERH